MRVLYFDCFSGISGDMTIAALLDLGLDPATLISELKKLDLPGWECRLERVVKNSISANYFEVITDESGSHVHDGNDHHHDHCGHEHSREHGHDDHLHGHNGHEHEHDGDDHCYDHSHGSHEHSHDGHHHEHGHQHTHNRSLTDIDKLIENSGLNPSVKSLARKMFYRIAVAEGKIHGNPPEQVHFHEVGAVDSIVDIVGAAILIDMLKPDKILSSVVNDGHGFTWCQHGRIPVPVPAVMEIMKDAGTLRQIQIPRELVTPTGAAIVAELSQGFGLMPEMTIRKVGYGAGKRDNEIPNVLRVVLGEIPDGSQNDSISVLETNIDDCSPEILGYAMEKLICAGALDVYFTNIYMKKNRPGVKLTVLCEENKVSEMEDILFSETTTIGIRKRIENRSVLLRRTEERDTPYGRIKMKIVLYDGRERAFVEYESAKKIAVENHIPIGRIYSLCQEGYE